MSFISVEPQSRILLESHNNYLLAQFDTQIRIIADRYLAFFRERRRIEAIYVDSLRNLHRKAKTVDASFDPRTEPTTTRRAWDKVRDNLGRDADARQGFMDILANDVIKPLEIFKESNDDIRDCVMNMLDLSASCYADHAEHEVSKLQQAYSRKYQPQQYAYSANVSQRPQDDPYKRFGSMRPAPHGVPEYWQGFEPAKAAPSEEVSDDDCREAVAELNKFRLVRANFLEWGYDLLEGLVFLPTIKHILLEYMDGMIKACAKHGDIVKSTGAEVENALGRTDTSDLRVSFRQALSFSTPPLTLYRNYRPGGYSNLIFGVPLVGHGITEDKVPKVMRMCIEEVEKRGLNIDKIYSSGSIYDTGVRKFLHRFESEKSFSFTSTDDIYSVATLLKRYLYDLPEPLLALPFHEHRDYAQHRGKYTKDNFSLWRSKIRELHPVHRASLEALLKHLLNVASHSDKNGMTVKELSALFYGYVTGDTIFTDTDNIYEKPLVLEDLIQNARTLFDERPSQSPPVPLSNVAEAKSTHTVTYYGSSVLSPELPRSADIQATGSTSRHRPGPGLVDGIHASRSTQSSFPSFPSDGAVANRHTAPQTALLSPLRGGSSSKRPTERVETTTQAARGTRAMSRPLPHSEAPTILQGPPESILSSMSSSLRSSATSLQTSRMWHP